MRIVAPILFFSAGGAKGADRIYLFYFYTPPLFSKKKLKKNVFFYTLTIFLTQSLVLKIVAYFMSEDHSLTDHRTEQTRTNMSQPGRRPGTAVGDERNVLQALWSKRDI